MSEEAVQAGTNDTTTGPRMEPFDEHNQRLVGYVHPHDWVNPEPRDRYHMVVIGAGTAGLVTAIVAAGLGARVALIEKHFMGGDCLNVGCVPSKGVISAARAWNQRTREPFGAPSQNDDGDFGKAMERMRKLRADISHVDSAERFSGLGIDVFLGAGRFVSDQAVEVDGKRLHFRKAAICTGARAAAPPIPGLDSVPYLTNETVFSLTERPKHMLVIGAGPIGCELAQSFARFGSQVTVFDLAPQVLIREDQDAAQVVQKTMVADGVQLELGTKIQNIEPSDGGIALHFERADGTTEVAQGDQILVAVGRKPNVENMGLEEIGVEFDGSGIKTNQRLQTTRPQIFAGGDVIQSLKFTHLADAHAAIIIQNALFFGRKQHGSLVVPWCTYTTPEIAHVGMYEKDARAKGHDVDVITIQMDDVDRAILDGQGEGFLRVILKKGSDQILGATLVADHAGDMIGGLCLAITHGIGLGKFASTIHPYPTQGEIVRKAAMAWRKQKLSPTVSKIFSLWFKLFK